MSDRNPGHPAQIRFLPWLLLFGLLIAYSSTVVGPMGLHYVPLDFDAAWRQFLARALTWVDNGSDQRADWMGNLCMLIPFGFLLAGTLAPRGGAGVVTCGLSLVLGAIFVLVMKYAQLFFPPRTVTLNYVVAQIGGTVLGIALFAGSHAYLTRPAWCRAGSARGILRLSLVLYAACVFAFMLMPLDFVLNWDDLTTRIEQVPGLLFTMPGAGRPAVVQIMVLLASVLAMVPFGALMVLAPGGRNRLFSQAMLRGLCWLAAVFVLSTLLLSGAPTLAALAARILGLTIGVRVMPWVVRRDPAALRRWLARWSLVALPPYLVLLASVNGLLSSHWLTFDAAIDAFHPRGMLPLFDYYIVSKGDAAKNIAAHIVMYMPLGLLAWIRGFRPRTAFCWGVVLALAVEFARFFRPNLQGDVNAIAVAGLAAMLTTMVMPGIWRLLEGVTLPTLARAPVQGPGWRERAASARLREASRIAVAKNEIENF